MATLCDCLGEADSVRGISKYHIQALIESGNATHLYDLVNNMEWRKDPSVLYHSQWKDPKSLAQVWICLSH